MFISSVISFILVTLMCYLTQKLVGFNVTKLIFDLMMILMLMPFIMHVYILAMSPPGDVEALTNFMTNYLTTFMNALPGMIVGEVVGSIAGMMKREFRRYY